MGRRRSASKRGSRTRSVRRPAPTQSVGARIWATPSAPLTVIGYGEGRESAVTELSSITALLTPPLLPLFALQSNLHLERRRLIADQDVIPREGTITFGPDDDAVALIALQRARQLKIAVGVGLRRGVNLLLAAVPAVNGDARVEHDVERPGDSPTGIGVTDVP